VYGTTAHVEAELWGGLGSPCPPLCGLWRCSTSKDLTLKQMPDLTEVSVRVVPCEGVLTCERACGGLTSVHGIVYVG